MQPRFFILVDQCFDLIETLSEFLIRGLTQLAKEKPGSGLAVVEWFANWMLDNNPNQPKIMHNNQIQDNLENLAEIDVKSIINNENLQFYEKCAILLKKANVDWEGITNSTNTANEKQIVESMIKFVFVLGGPGSGKGTQCDKIVSKFNFIHISTGDILRRIAKNSDNSDSKVTQIKSIMKQGKLIPNEMMINLLETEILSLLNEKLKQIENFHDTMPSFKFLIDGFPRTLEQTILFESNILPTQFAVYFQVPTETLLQRCLGRAQANAANGNARADDNEVTIKQVCWLFTGLPLIYISNY